VFRADTAWFPQRLTLDVELGDEGWAGALSTTARRAALGDVRAVWYRSPTAFQLGEGLSGPERRHAAFEAKFGLGGVLWSMSVLWVNHPARQADLYKPTQLAVARTCGLTPPRTVVTNQSDAVRRFARHVDGPIIVKPLGFASIPEGGQRHPLWTHVLTDDELDDLRGVEATAHLFQQFIDKAYEVRLSVVGSRMFAAAIHSGSKAARVDFRSDYAALTYTVTEVPARIATGVELFMRHFGLTFGAFDFAIDRSGHWWFLECNPGGQYSFVEHATGLPITAALADLLEKGTT
jgi:ATP-grasp ribosomal peptide maturase